ncbi:MAG: hypothetical protein K8S23_02175 [Candidatus Cloacimonetes bacterium]|nr:hypothetical protein [Candidatus Cloacimonadota bacterium]
MKNILSLFVLPLRRGVRGVTKYSLHFFLFVLISVNSWLHSLVITVNQDGTGDFTAIQVGIDASVVSDTVLVYPGTYFENINFNAKDIIVGSLLLTTGDQNYIYNTIIDANHNGRVVTFENDETNDAVLIGFTIQNGFATTYNMGDGAGIFINFSSPSLKFLNIKENIAQGGAGLTISSSNCRLEGLSITNNQAQGAAGLMIVRKPPNPINSYPIFSSENKCSIYSNFAGYASDIYISENHTPVTNIILDTLSVFEPNWDFASQFPNMNLEIENDWLEQVEHDLYVSPEGDDNNSGINENVPLQTIQWALTKIKADSLNPRNIYLAQGNYSPELTGEKYPLNMRAYVNIIGAGIDETFLTDPYDESFFIFAFFDEYFSIANLTMQNFTSHQYAMLYAEYTNISLDDLNIKNNESEYNIIYFATAEEVSIENVFLENNSTGRAVKVGSSSVQNNIAIINNLTISGNEPVPNSNSTGAILNATNTQYTKITNSLFFNNHTESNDWPPCHFYFHRNDTLDFFNNTVTNNSSNSSYACLFGVGDVGENEESVINIKNCNIYGNSTPYIFGKSNGYGPATINISHSIIEGGTEPEILNIANPGSYQPEFIFGEGIIDAPPLFVGGDWDDPLAYQLAEGSPGIDAGTPDTTGMYLPLEDLLGNWRVWDGDDDGTSTIDIGCYEYDAPPYTSGINEDELPHFSLLTSNLMNYPNPFRISSNKRNCATTFKFNVLKEGKVRLDVYNIKGQKVKNLYDVYTVSGDCEIMWNGLDNNGKPVSTGLYLYKLESAGITEIKKLLIVK